MEGPAFDLGLEEHRVLTGGWVFRGGASMPEQHEHRIRIHSPVYIQKTEVVKFGCELGCLQGNDWV